MCSGTLRRRAAYPRARIGEPGAPPTAHVTSVGRHVGGLADRPARADRPLDSAPLWSSPPSSSASSSRSSSWWPWLLRPFSTRWKVFMLVASYVFYGWWRFDVYHGRYCLLLVALDGRQPDLRARHLARPRRTPAGAACSARWPPTWRCSCGSSTPSGSSAGCNGLSATGTLPLVDVILPIGVSFFMFQAISYVVDTYRRQLQPVALLDFATYLSFFPHLVAGPIVRVREFVPAAASVRADPRQIDSARAFRLIMFGLAKKVIIAEQLANSIVNRSSTTRPSTAPSTTWSASTPTPSRSTPTSPATPTSPSASRCCSASSSRRTSTRRTSPPRSRTSGADGT